MIETISETYGKIILIYLSEGIVTDIYQITRMMKFKIIT